MPRPCPVCGSRKWRKDAISGSAICEDGHVFQDFRSENLVVENSAYALQRRSLKKGPRRNKRREKGDVNKEYYWNDDAEYLKLQALQLLLRLQIQALKPIWSLPDTFDQVVRDLWAYQLASATLPPPPRTSREGADDHVQGDNSRPEESEHPEDDEDKSVESRDSDSEGEPELDEQVDDAAIEAEMMAQLSPDTSDEEDESPNAERRSLGRAPTWRRKRRLQIQDTLVTIVVGLWVMRIPLLSGDLEDLVNLNSIPYLEFGHTNLIPDEMRKHMNRELVLALSPRVAPRVVLLHKHCTAFVGILTRHFHIAIPEANIAPLSWRVLSTLGGTPSIYCQVMRLLALLDVNLSLTFRRCTTVTRKVSTSTLAESLERTYERRSVYDDVWLPEVTISAAFIMVLKMMYGFDGVSRPPLILSDPIIGMPREEQWIEELARLSESGTLGGQSSQQSRLDFVAMDLDEIDTFLDISEKVLLKDRQHVDESMFPLSSSGNGAELPASNVRGVFTHWTKGSLIEASTTPTTMANRDLPLLPAEQLKSYDADDITGTLPRQYDMLLKACAAVVRVDEQHVAKCVQVFERRLERLRAERAAKDNLKSRAKSLSRRNSGVGQARRSVSLADLRRAGVDVEDGPMSAT